MPNVNYIVSGSEISFVKYKSSYYKLVTAKVKQGVINSFRPSYVSSLACSLFPLFSLLSGEEERKLSLLFTLQHSYKALALGFVEMNFPRRQKVVKQVKCLLGGKRVPVNRHTWAVAERERVVPSW